MGNNHSHVNNRKGQESTPSTGSNSNNSSRRDISRSGSGSDIQEKPATLLPLEKLSKILVNKSQDEEGITGIGYKTFAKYLFPRYPLLAEKLYQHMHKQCKSKVSYIKSSDFKQQCEKFLTILDDETARNVLVRMFSVGDDNDMMSPDSFKSLLMCAYHVTMDHYSEGPQMCLSISKTLKSVVDSCFHTKNLLSWQYVAHWVEANCPRLLLPLHRYAIHALATSYRHLETEEPSLAADESGTDVTAQEGLELATPVLEQPPPFGQGKHIHQHLLHMSMSWLLAGALPQSFSRPVRAHSPNNSGVGLASQSFLTKLLCAMPSHWIILYDSEEMGLGANRFLHHVLAYKGPTLCLIQVEGGSMFCIAAPNEWKESHLYWGGEDAALYQLFPKFLLLEKGSKMLYLNTSVRGYPQGLRVGKDPRSPIISINSGFDKMEYRKIPYSIHCIEVWGCGDQSNREVQLDIKKWEVKEAERQRCVKLSATDWLDHPDRYLLELAGRPQYNQNQT